MWSEDLQGVEERVRGPAAGFATHMHSQHLIASTGMVLHEPEHPLQQSGMGHAPLDLASLLVGSANCAVFACRRKAFQRQQQLIRAQSDHISQAG